MPQELPLPLPGTVVHARGRRWRVVDAAQHADCGLCRLADADPSKSARQVALIIPFDRLTPVAAAAPVKCGRRRWVRALGSRLIEAAADGDLRAAAMARFELLPYQLEPALAVLRGESRLLIADDVGLGKTVQAALILAEIFAREPEARCMVTTPASLCAQWVGELRGRFHLPAQRVDRGTLQRLACFLPPGSLVWDRLPLPVTSFDFAKRPEVLRHLSSLRWDALIVDEAHMASLAPERAAAIAALAARARRIVLLTATPHASDTEGLQALCDLGRLPREGPILAFRRGRSDLGIAGTRRVHLLRVRLTPAERRMHAALERYTTEVWRESGNGARTNPDARLAMIVLRKRAASGPTALLASLRRRLSLLDDGSEADRLEQLRLPLEPDEEHDAADEEPAAALAAPGLRDRDTERDRLAHLVEHASRACAADSKLAVLERLLRRSREPVIVFTEYRDTLSRLAIRLSAGCAPILLHGGLDQAERHEAVRAFTAGDARVLLATDAAAHGLNLHARCRLVVNIELPWMPSRLEQRAGRVDRIGQSRRVHVMHLVGRGTSEGRVLARLAARIQRERDALGLAADPLGSLRSEEIEVARAIFEGHAAAARQPPSTEPFFRRIDLSAKARAERERLETVRQLIDARDRQPASRPGGRVGVARACFTVIRRRRGLSSLPLGLVCIFITRLVNGRGSLVEELLTVVHVCLDPARCRRHDLERVMPRLLGACGRTLVDAARREVLARAAVLRGTAGDRVATLALREAELGQQAPEQQPVQPGLFDKRAVRAAAEKQRRRDAEGEETDRRLDALERERSIEVAGEPELVLALGVAL